MIRRTLLVLVAVALASASAFSADDTDLEGFSGRVRGVVRERTEKGFVTIEVAKLEKTWKANEAKDPEKIVGRTVTVGPRWVKGEEGRWHAVERHVKFLAKLRPGEELSIELRYAELGRFAILELTKEQRARAEKPAEEAKKEEAEEHPEDRGAPEGLAGFSGRVRGVVVAKDEKGGVTLKVAKLLDVWKGSRATKPKAIVGRTVPVGPRWEKGENGKWHRVEAHVRFLHTLSPGDEITLEIRHAERDRFAILELSKEQRETR